MNTTQLECFLAVADCLNFSRAAQRLQLTQPAVSHQVRTLEDELGVKLFHRTSKSVRMTQEGHMFLQYASDILKLTDLSKVQVRQCSAGRPDWLGIGCRSAAGLQLIRPALELLRTARPKTVPLPRLIPFSALDNLLAEGEIQLLLTFQESAPRGSVYRELVRCPVVCLCREDHPLADLNQVTPKQLYRAGRIAACRPPLCPPSLFALQGQLVTAVHPDQAVFCDSLEALLTLVETGYAISVAACFPTLPRPGLRCVPLAGQSPLSFGAAWRRDNRSPALRALLPLLEQTLRPAEQAP